MIRKIYSTLDTFKTLTFHDGLNILLVDKTTDATDRQTRNRAGKTSFVELVNFLLGSQCDKGSLFKRAEVIEHSFMMDFDLGGLPCKVERSGSVPGRVIIESDTSAWPLNTARENGTIRKSVSVDSWKLILGHFMFGLDVSARLRKAGKLPESHQPTFRMIFPYYARRQGDGGIVEPERNATKQQPWQQQVALSYMLSLDWTVAQRFQEIRDRESKIEKLKSAAKGGAFGDIVGTAAELRTKSALADRKVSEMRDRVQKFQVADDYDTFEKEASALSRQLSDISDSNTIDYGLIAEFKASLQCELPPPVTDLEALYKEANVVLPSLVARRFDEVRRFHESVIVNRKSYLEQQIAAAEERIRIRQQEARKIEARQSQVLTILKTHGALEKYTELCLELSRQEAVAETIRQKLSTAIAIEDQDGRLQIERAQLLRELQKDYQEQSEKIVDAVALFGEISQTLLETSGSFKIEPTINGPVFDVTIPGDNSTGIKHQEIVCFDLMLTTIMARKGLGAGFLIHDSHVFDPLDERQTASALSIGGKLAKRLGFQYIVTMNSDTLPDTLPDLGRSRDYVVDPILTDDEQVGGLFGMRF